jgi:hypothetical protein
LQQTTFVLSGCSCSPTLASLSGQEGVTQTSTAGLGPS